MISKIFLGILIILIIAVGAVFFFNKPKTESLTGETISETTEKIVAYVNDNPITQEEVERAQRYVGAQSGRIINQTEALQRVISEKLILEDAEKNSFTQTIGETEEEISRILSTQNQTLTDFRSRIESRGGNYEEELENYRKQLLIEKYLDKIAEQNVTDAQALDYYNANKDKMFVGEVAVPYEQISQQLKSTIAKKQGQEKITTYLAKLHENARIIYVS